MKNVSYTIVFELPIVNLSKSTRTFRINFAVVLGHFALSGPDFIRRK